MNTSTEPGRTAPIRLAFFGTAPLAEDILRELEAAELTPALIIASPDKFLSRGKKVEFPPEKKWALERNIPILQPERLDDAFVAALANETWDVFVVASYGKIIPKALLEIPRKGVINVHPSLLPKLRGPSPIRSAILNDEKDVGVSVMLLDEKMDHGPILAQERVEVREWPPRGRDLDKQLAEAGARLLARVVPQWLDGTIQAQEQNHDAATFCKMFTKEMAEIDLSDDPYQNLLKIRAFDGWPGAYTFIDARGKRMRIGIESAHLEKDALILDEVKPEGKQRMKYQDFLRGIS